MKKSTKKEVVLNRKKDSKEVIKIEVNSLEKVRAKTAKAISTEQAQVKRMKTSFSNFAEFKKVVNNLDNKCAFTLHENRLLLASRTLENHLKAIIDFRLSVKEYKANKHIQNVSKLRNHIKWLRERGFVFTENKSKQIKISNYVKA